MSLNRGSRPGCSPFSYDRLRPQSAGRHPGPAGFCRGVPLTWPAVAVLDDSVLGDLDPEQQAVVAAPVGPVCVLAGAGTGKTRAITRRIAHLVTNGTVPAGQVLAVTFTARAAGELRSRPRALGAEG